MEGSGDSLPVSPSPAVVHDTPTGRLYLAKAFKHLLIVTSLTTIPALLCFANILNYWEETPRHFCNLTRYCGQLSIFPIFLFFLSVLVFVPTLLVLDHYLAVSPLFGYKTLTSGDLTSIESDAQDDSTNESEVDSHNTSIGPSSYARWTLMTLNSAVYAAATLWVVASIAATTSAALIIKYDEPFDDRSDSKFKLRVIVGLSEAAFDLVVAGFSVWLGLLYSRARRSIPVDTASASTSAAQVSRTLAQVSLLDVWRNLCRLWDRKKGLDKPIFCLIFTFGVMIVAIAFYSSSTPPSWKYFFGSYFFYTIILTYPFLFTFHRWRTAAVIPGAVARGFAFFIFSFFAVFWAFFSASFLAVVFYGMFCDPWRREPHPLPCPQGGQWRSLVVGVLGLLLSFSLGTSAMAAWKLRAGIQLEDAAEDGAEPTQAP